MTSDPVNLAPPSGREFDLLVVGRAGLDLYPEPDGCEIEDALSFSSDLGGSAGLIAVAASRAGGRCGLISALSDDAVGRFVHKRLTAAGVDTQHVVECKPNSRTSLALAEVRNDDCEVVIYRNSAADLDWQYTEPLRGALTECANLVVTGTCLIDPQSRSQALALLRDAHGAGCLTWLDLDYRPWNWPDASVTRDVYCEAAAFTRVLVGNEDEFAVLDDSLEARIATSRGEGQAMILKRGGQGATLFCNDSQLNTGVYPVKALKPYGSGDAFLGNLIITFQQTRDWAVAMDTGAAAAALVVSQRGCASVMPKPDDIEQLRASTSLTCTSFWS